MLWLMGTALAWSQTADMVIRNAVIYTVDPGHPKASAIAVKDGKVLAVGPDVSSHVGPQTMVVDAKGATVVPGFIDSHVHMANYGAVLETFDLRTVKTVAEVARIAGDAAKKLPTGEWVLGRAWDQTNWGGTFPTAKDLDGVVADRPVWLRRVDGHAAWANSKAMQIAGVTRETADPPGGKIIRDSEGNPTGIFVDRAMGLVQSKVPPTTGEQVERRLTLAANDCVRQGLTSVHDAGVDAQTMAVYERLAEAGRLPLHIYAMIGGDGPAWQSWQQRGPLVSDALTVRAIKLVADGAMGSGGAAFFQPYSDQKDNSGLLILSQAQIAKVAKEAVAHGFQVATHAIGDRANRTALDGYAEALKPNNDARFRIEHAQIVSLPDFAKFKEFAVIASVQATHATSDMRWALKKLGPDRIQGAYAWQRFLKAGVKIANGSDFPVESNRPLWGFYASVTRQDHDGNPAGGFTPDQVLSRDEALRSFTLDGAYAAFEENRKGSLTPGKLADLVMLSNDIMTVPPKEILKTKILMTVVSGKVAYRAE